MVLIMSDINNEVLAVTARTRSLPLMLAAMMLACGGTSEDESPSEAAGLQVERLTEGDITVVRNLSGSKWGGNATLEVVLEIGVDEGDDRYMFNNPYRFWLTDDEIYVLESQDGRVRVYGLDGEHRRDFGSPGQGPGEFENAGHLAITPDGRVAVTTMSGSAVKTSFFSPDGEFIDEWRTGESTPGSGVMPVPYVVLPLQDSVLVSVFGGMMGPAASWERDIGMVAFGPEGYQGEPWFVPEIKQEPATYSLTMRGFTMERPVPWSISRPIMGALSDGSVLWTHGDSYRFHIVSPDGSTTAVERVVDPVPIDPDEAEYRSRMTVAQMRRRAPDFDWDGAGIPATKPWIRSFVADRSERIWVSREGRGKRVSPCTEDPVDLPRGEQLTSCWQSESLLDGFDRNGEFLGSLERPEGLQLIGAFFRGDLVVAGYYDEFDIPKVRLYRLVLPANGR